MLKQYSKREIKKICKTDSIAIVGNAPSALNYQIGDLINQADCVVRMNNYSISKDHQPFVGKKTDVYISNFYRKDPMKKLQTLRNDGVKMIWSSILNSKYLDYVDWPNDLFQGEQDYQPYLIFYPNIDQFFCGFYKKDFHILLKSLAYKTLGYKLFEIINYHWPVPTTGLIAIILALDLRPQKIIITGFNFFSTKKSHYFDDESPDPQDHHNFSEEAYVLNKLIQKNKKVKFTIAINPGLGELGTLGNNSNIEFVEIDRKQDSCVIRPK